MGLDMYLSKKTYIGANYEHRKIEGTIALTKNGEEIKINLKRVSEIIESIGYWRKANHIHNWFVENVQDGEDDCKDYYVSDSALKKLLEDCKQALKNKAEAATVLPTKEGFFFGGTDYDEYYFKNIEETIKIVETCLSEDGDYYYTSSW